MATLIPSPTHRIPKHSGFTLVFDEYRLRRDDPTGFVGGWSTLPPTWLQLGFLMIVRDAVICGEADVRGIMC